MNNLIDKVKLLKYCDITQRFFRRSQKQCAKNDLNVAAAYNQGKANAIHYLTRKIINGNFDAEEPREKDIE